MKSIIVLFVLLISNTSKCQSTCEFMSIPFGLTQSEFNDELTRKNFKLIRDNIFTGVFLDDIVVTSSKVTKDSGKVYEIVVLFSNPNIQYNCENYYLITKEYNKKFGFKEDDNFITEGLNYKSKYIINNISISVNYDNENHLLFVIYTDLLLLKNNDTEQNINTTYQKQFYAKN